MNDEYVNGYIEGKERAMNELFVEFFNRMGKKAVIKALITKAHEGQRPQNGAIKNDQLEAYSEGFRHCLNILNSLGDGVEAYNNIINPSIKVSLTKEDVKRLA